MQEKNYIGVVANC